MDFTLKVVGGDISAIPGVADALESTIHDAVEDSITWPVRKVIPILPGDYRVATSKNPVIFLGTGKLMDEFESFDVRSFVSHLLGEDDPPGFMDKNHEFVSMGQQLESLKKLSEENCTLRIMNEQYQKMEVVLAALSICQLPPGVMPDGRPKKRLADIKKYMRIMDYMTDEELDSTNPNHMNESRMMQIAEASNLHMNEVLKMFEEYGLFANIWNVIKGLQFHKKEDMRLLIQYMNELQEKMVIPPQLLRVRDDELQKLLKQMECSLVAMVLEQEDA